MSSVSEDYKKLLDTFPEAARAYIDDVRAKLSLALFSKLPTVSEEEKDSIVNLVCLFCLSAYNKGQRDSLELIHNTVSPYLKNIDISVPTHE